MENAEILRFEQETNAKTGYIYTLEKSKHALKVVPMEPTKKKNEPTHTFNNNNHNRKKGERKNGLTYSF